MFQHVVSVGAEEGIEFAFDRVATAPNTADAHRLILFARTVEMEKQAALALFRAYFTDGTDLNDLHTLATLGEGIGLNADELRTHLRSTAGIDEVRESQAESCRGAWAPGLAGMDTSSNTPVRAQKAVRIRDDGLAERS